MTVDAHPVRWKDDPDDHDYPAASAYLSLLAPRDRVRAMVDALRAAPTDTRKAKDLLRASGLPPLSPDDVHVAADLAKAQRGEALSPVLVVRGDLARGVPAQIADGYHRVCAAYHLGDDTAIPCRIVSAP